MNSKQNDLGIHLIFARFELESILNLISVVGWITNIPNFY